MTFKKKKKNKMLSFYIMLTLESEKPISMEWEIKM